MDSPDPLGPDALAGRIRDMLIAAGPFGLTEHELADRARALIADELDLQADLIARRIRMHGLGRHVVNPCLRCEAWREDERALRRRAVALRRPGEPARGASR